MKEIKYPLNFFNETEEMNYLTIESFLTAISDEEVLGGRMPSSLAECKKLLTNELKEIVENALIRHLELWVESLNEKVEVDDSNNFVFKGNLYSGILYRETTANRICIYYKSPTENTLEILYAKEGKILDSNLAFDVVQYLSKDKWYVTARGRKTIIFNLIADNPICFKIINNIPTRVEQPISFVSDMIFSGLIPTEITNFYKMFS
jgi:hypothetical protein